MHRLQEKILRDVYPVLTKQFGIINIFALPKIRKISVNVGLGKSLADSSLTDIAVRTLERITGQKPVLTKAKKSISNFKVRQGQVIGATVTLRGPRMYDFLDKLINVTLPRVRDFRGISQHTIDARGNMSLGFKEHLVFPEIRSDEVEKLHGLQVNIHTTAGNKEIGTAFLSALGMPFSQNDH